MPRKKEGCVCVCMCVCVCVCVCVRERERERERERGRERGRLASLEFSDEKHSPLKNRFLDFPGGRVVRNLPANAQGTRVQALIQEDPTCKYVHVPQLLSLRSRARELQLLSPRATTTEAHVPRAHALQQGKPLK